MYIYYLDPTTTREGLAVLFNRYNWQLASCNCVNLVIDLEGKPSSRPKLFQTTPVTLGASLTTFLQRNEKTEEKSSEQGCSWAGSGRRKKYSGPAQLQSTAGWDIRALACPFSQVGQGKPNFSITFAIFFWQIFTQLWKKYIRAETGFKLFTTSPNPAHLLIEPILKSKSVPPSLRTPRVAGGRNDLMVIGGRKEEIGGHKHEFDESWKHKAVHGRRSTSC